MVNIEFPELNVDNIKIFVTEEFPVPVDIVLVLDVPETGGDFGSFVLADVELPVEFLVGGVEDAVDHADGVPVLEFRGLLEEFKARVDG